MTTAEKTRGIVWLMAGLLLAACGGSDGEKAEKVCDPGVVQLCPCSASTEGTQVCSEDGTRWGACENCAASDGDAAEEDASDDDRPEVETPDGDAPDTETPENDASDGDASDGEATDGDREESESVDGEAAEPESPEAEGVEEETSEEESPDSDRIETPETEETDAEPEAEAEAEAEAEPETEAEPEAEPEPVGRCSATGEACHDLLPCAAATAVIHGRCSVASSGSNNVCLYPPRRDRPTSYTCQTVSYDHCDSTYDCPFGIGCGAIGANWCAPGSALIEKVCLSVATLSSGSTPCLDDAQCDQTVSNVCVIVGNSQVDSMQEECDDGNTTPDDGCSETGQREGLCKDTEFSSSYFGECATDEDCASAWECQETTCVCHIP